VKGAWVALLIVGVVVVGVALVVVVSVDKGEAGENEGGGNGNEGDVFFKVVCDEAEGVLLREGAAFVMGDRMERTERMDESVDGAEGGVTSG